LKFNSYANKENKARNYDLIVSGDELRILTCPTSMLLRQSYSQDPCKLTASLNESELKVFCSKIWRDRRFSN